LIVFDTLQNLRTGSRGAVPVEIEIIQPKAGVLEFIRSLPFVSSAAQVEARFDVQVVEARVNVPVLVRALAERGEMIMQVTPRVHSLEEVYLRSVHTTEGGSN